MKVWPGKPYPLGATWDGDGVNFALFAENAEGVELCLYGPRPDRKAEVVRLPEVTAHVWHGYLPGVRPGQAYGYRVHGRFDPVAGYRYNPNKLLIDPYARALAGQVDWDAPVFGYPLKSKEQDLRMDRRDDQRGVPKSLVIDPSFDWGDDRPPRTSWHRSVIYEAHVKGLTYRHPKIDERLRGSYAGVASPPIIEHFQQLGITAVELMPIHAFLSEKFLLDKGLTNYWGYSTLNYFAPDARYSSSGDSGGQVNEFKTMVKDLHAAGLEVILDVVYNHTAEGNQLGPTLSFRGIDNSSYYRLVGNQPRYYMDYTGTGNSLNMLHPQTIKLIMDSLRYWVQEMHVDGFRFDLAATLARELHEVDRLSAFFDVIHQDPVLSRVKLIAEPWDVGEGGYQVGNFPVLWTEWNGVYRDTMRSFWKGDEVGVGEFAVRWAGSSDMYQSDGRRPYASVNLITAHDGFTLNDLVSYNDKHNEANGEGNRDGHDHNLSWNCGVEGPTEDPAIRALREKQMRNFLATLLFSQGVPMICGGDEIGRTQLGNNNAYCQDNEISWHDWNLDDSRDDLLAFAQKVVSIRHQQPVLRRRKFFQGRPIHGSDIKDVTWYRPDGQEMNDDDWAQTRSRTLGILLSGDGLDQYDERGELVRGSTLLLLFNAFWEACPFNLPSTPGGTRWELMLDTARPTPSRDELLRDPKAPYPLADRSLVLLRQVLSDEPTNGK